MNPNIPLTFISPTMEEIKTWLRSFEDQETIVGQCFSDQMCPVANFLLQKYDANNVYVRSDYLEIRLPNYRRECTPVVYPLNRYISRIDHYGRLMLNIDLSRSVVQVTASVALRLAEEIKGDGD